jgi:hypothetical protein
MRSRPRLAGSAGVGSGGISAGSLELLSFIVRSRRMARACVLLGSGCVIVGWVGLDKGERPAKR